MGSNDPSLFPISTETVCEKKSGTARSVLPSPFTSPIAMEKGRLPVSKSDLPWKVPLPFPRSTETLLEM